MLILHSGKEPLDVEADRTWYTDVLVSTYKREVGQECDIVRRPARQCNMCCVRVNDARCSRGATRKRAHEAVSICAASLFLAPLFHIELTYLVIIVV